MRRAYEILSRVRREVRKKSSVNPELGEAKKRKWRDWRTGEKAGVPKVGGGGDPEAYGQEEAEGTACSKTVSI